MTDLSSKARNIPEDTLARIGAVAVLWGAIDHYMNHIIWTLADLPMETGREFTVGQKPYTKTRLIISLMELKKVSAGARKSVRAAVDCAPAWNFDPVGGVIGVQN